VAGAPLASPPGAALRRAAAIVDLGAVARNCGRLKDALGAAELCAVVKADGYGHGATACARASLAGGASRLAVATAAEAVELRNDGIDAPLLVMGALSTAELEDAVAAGADVVCWRPAFVADVAAAAERAGKSIGVHSKLDSGMGRLGTRDPEEALAVLEAAARADGLRPAGLMTHFATADEPDASFMEEQLARFGPVVERARGSHAGLTVHAANSAAALREPRARFDMARCGIAVYGLDPFGADPAEQGLEPALRLESYVAEVKRFDEGDSAGYGRSWRAPAPTSVAVLPIGYGDGYRRGLSNRADVLIGPRRYPVAGTVSMDNITVDVGADSPVRTGDGAVLIGSEGSERILAEELARTLGTINYEVTCGLTARVPRVHVGAPA
jgi:alanine racemase